jgi:hypothetical protein
MNGFDLESNKIEFFCKAECIFEFEVDLEDTSLKYKPQQLANSLLIVTSQKLEANILCCQSSSINLINQTHPGTLALFFFKFSTLMSLIIRLLTGVQAFLG